MRPPELGSETEQLLPSSGGQRATVAETRSRRVMRQSRRSIGVLVLILAWYLVTRAEALTPAQLPSPASVWTTTTRLVGDGSLARHMAVSLGRVVRGLVLGCAIGGTLGLLAGLSRLGEQVIDAPIQLVRGLPVLALTPMFIVWFGIGELSKVLLIAWAASFPIYLNTYGGVRNVDNNLVEVGRVFRLSWFQLTRTIVLPAALPQMLVGLRQAVTISWLVLVVSEQVNAAAGIGFLMARAQIGLQTDIIMMGLLIYGTLGLVTDVLVRFIERRLLSWRVTFAGA